MRSARAFLFFRKQLYTYENKWRSSICYQLDNNFDMRVQEGDVRRAGGNSLEKFSQTCDSVAANPH